jgi:transposase
LIKEIQCLIESDPTFNQTLLRLLSVPGLGSQLAAHLLIVMLETLDPTILAAFIGICPIKHKTGTSAFSTPASRHDHPPVLRKLLHPGADPVRTHKKQFQQYFFRKAAEGKYHKVVLNHIENKILQIACRSCLHSQKPTSPTMSLSTPWSFKKP